MNTTQAVTAFSLVMVCLCHSAHVHQETPGSPGPDLVLEALKTGILSSLGMERPPVVQQRAPHTELMKMQQLYLEKLSELGLSAPRSNRTSTLLLPNTVEKLQSGHRADSLRRHVHWHRAMFVEKPRIQDELSLLRAELHMSRHVLEQASRKVKVHLRSSQQMRHAEWADTASDENGSQSLVLDVSEEVQMWIRDGRRPLEVDIGNRGEDYQFNISLKLTLEHTTRRTRSVKEDECGEDDLCCRQSMTVSFKDIGWTDWVVAPLEYTMHFCQGSCPHNYKPASMHTQVKSRMAQVSKGVTPQPCCVPSEYQPMVLMHYDSRSRLKLTPFEDLIVSKCYCA